MFEQCSNKAQLRGPDVGLSLIPSQNARTDYSQNSAYSNARDEDHFALFFSCRPVGQWPLVGITSGLFSD